MPVRAGKNALRGDLKPWDSATIRAGRFQENQTSQALNDSADCCLRRFARKQAAIRIEIAEMPVWHDYSQRP
jgi:hypothetical protein